MNNSFYRIPQTVQYLAVVTKVNLQVNLIAGFLTILLTVFSPGPAEPLQRTSFRTEVSAAKPSHSARKCVSFFSKSTAQVSAWPRWISTFHHEFAIERFRKFIFIRAEIKSLRLYTFHLAHSLPADEPLLRAI